MARLVRFRDRGEVLFINRAGTAAGRGGVISFLGFGSFSRRLTRLVLSVPAGPGHARWAPATVHGGDTEMKSK